MTRLPRVAAVIVTLAAAVLATTAQGDAHAASAAPAQTASSAAATPARTHLILHFTGCDRCVVAAQHAVNGQEHVWTSPSKRIGSDHTVDLTVRTSNTRGMSFLVTAPWEGNTGAVSNIVTRYVGHSIDSFVGQDAARHSRRAEGCWAGTRVDEMRLSFHIGRVPAKTLDGQPTQIPLAYATHSMSSWRPMVKAYKGTIGNQDAFWCTTPKTTKVTLTAPGCDGCVINVMNGAARLENAWEAPQKTFKNGQVTVQVPRTLTRGISANIYGPWEGNTGYATLVAWRYGGRQVGDTVSFAGARASRHGSPCWGGTDQAATTIPLTVRKVRVAGNTGPTNGTIAFAQVTQPWLDPMEKTGNGILGTQEVIACHK
jgi:hypothetical protein